MPTTPATAARARRADLRLMLQARRREAQGDVQTRLHDVRADGRAPVVRDTEHVEVDIQDDIELALIQMKAEILVRIDEALVRLDAGEYGLCAECDGEISGPRLRALPFAVRCTACEQLREQSDARERRVAGRRSGPSVFADMATY